MKVTEQFESLFEQVRRYVSPVFVMLLVASFVLWYLAKLNYTYTTEQNVTVDIDGERLGVCCVVEGVGTNLLGYKLNGDKQLSIPLGELKYRWSSDEELRGCIEINPQSLQNAIATRCTDIKVVSIKGSIEPIPYPRREKQ